MTSLCDSRKSPSVPDDNWLKYFIAACVLGTAVGNMFVARRMKSFEHLSSPFSKKTASQNERHSSQHYEDILKRQAAEEVRKRERVRDFNYEREQTHRVREQYDNWYRKKSSNDKIPFVVVNAMKILDVTSTNFSKESIKIAYQRAAMKYHPDTIPWNDSRRAMYEGKFKEIGAAYQELLKYCKDQKT